jgi:hypothetical protein
MGQQIAGPSRYVAAEQLTAAKKHSEIGRNLLEYKI